MTIASTALSAGSAVCGFVGAWYWWKASRVPLLVTGDWSGNQELNRMTREAELLTALSTAGQLNAIAAKWTGVAAALVGLSALPLPGL